MGQIAGALFFGIFIGTWAGALVTRQIMAPSFCPDCLQRKRWEAALRQEIEGRTPEEKSESRHFYAQRKKDKKPNGEQE